MIEIHDALTDDERSIREEVFIKEQGFSEEFDDIDKKSKHILIYVDENPAGVCRVYGTGAENEFSIGRVAVRKEFRTLHIGSELISEAEKLIKSLGGKKAVVSAQTRVSGFYKKCGYVEKGEVYYDEFCPHIKMEKVL